jgi:Ca2+-binding EF-hand superfamily protein
MAAHPSDREIEGFFRGLDQDHDGLLSKKEVGKLMAKLGEKVTSLLSHKKLDHIFEEMDVERNGTVSLGEFLEWHKRTHATNAEDMEANISRLFHELDTDGSGFLSKSEVGTLTDQLGEHVMKGRRRGLFRHLGSAWRANKWHLEDIFADMAAGDDKVTYEEFLAWHKREHPLIWSVHRDTGANVDVAQIHLQYKTEIAALKAAHAKEIQEHDQRHNQHAEELKSLRAEHERQLRAHEARHDEHKIELARARADHAAAIVKQHEEHSAHHAAVVAEHQKRYEDLRSTRHAARMKGMEQQELHSEVVGGLEKLRDLLVMINEPKESGEDAATQ